MAKGKVNFRLVLYVVASVLTILYFGKHLYRGVFDPTHQKVAVKTGAETKFVQLPDSSSVVLSANSKFFYMEQFSEGLRKTELIGGGLINIANSHVPFKLKLKNALLISCFGQLKIIDKDNSYTVQILKGDFSVEVYDADGKLDVIKTVSDGQQLRVTSKVQIL